jgi:hypothetical protein
MERKVEEEREKRGVEEEKTFQISIDFGGLN